MTMRFVFAVSVVCLVTGSLLVGAGSQAARQLPQADRRSAAPSILVAPPALAVAQPLTADTLRATINAAMSRFDLMFAQQAQLFGVSADDQKALMSSQVPIGFPTLIKTKELPDPGPEVSAADPKVRPLQTQPRIEAQIGDNDFLPVRFLEGGVIAARAVGRVASQFEALPDAGLGTGFMVSPTLFITNHHVIPDLRLVEHLELQFNYQYNLDGSAIFEPVTYEFDGQSFFDTNEGLDFTVIRVKPRAVTPTPPGASMSTSTAGAEFGFLQLTDRYDYSKGQYANVIQHPAGRPKEIALRNNVVDGIYANVIRYTTDTENGSSGSPVLNNSWKVIALHHAAGEPDAQSGRSKNNEGIRIDAILKYMRSKYTREILKELGIG